MRGGGPGEFGVEGETEKLGGGLNDNCEVL